MNNRIQTGILLGISLLLIMSCSNQRNPRTIYWSGFGFERTDDTSNYYSLYLAYYIEVSDTGQAKLMTRRIFNGPEEYYKIRLPDSIKNLILKLASTDSMYNESVINYNNQSASLNEDFKNNLILKFGTINKSISLIRISESNHFQKELIRIMNKIQTNPDIISNTNLDLKHYKNNLEKSILSELSKKGVPPPKKSERIIEFERIPEK